MSLFVTFWIFENFENWHIHLTHPPATPTDTPPDTHVIPNETCDIQCDFFMIFFYFFENWHTHWHTLLHASDIFATLKWWFLINIHEFEAFLTLLNWLKLTHPLDTPTCHAHWHPCHTHMMVTDHPPWFLCCFEHFWFQVFFPPSYSLLWHKDI